MISAVVYFVSDFIFAPLEVGCVLRIILVICGCATRRKSGLALVAMTSWSRIPRFSAHSPMNSSDDSSCLKSNMSVNVNPRTIYDVLIVRCVNKVSLFNLVSGNITGKCKFNLHPDRSRHQGA